MGLITEREYDVLIRMHWTADETAKELNIKTVTVKKLRQKLFRKLHTKNTASTIVKALKYRIIELEALEPNPWKYQA